MDTEGEMLRKSHSVARCAKSAMLLLSLKQSPYLNRLKSKSTYYEVQQENELMKRMIEDLKTSLTIERMKRRRKVKLVDLLALILQIALLLSLWIFVLVTAFDFH